MSWPLHRSVPALILLCLLAGISSAQQPVIAEGYAAADPGKTIAEIQSAARDDARGRAIAKIAPVLVQSEVYRSQTEAISGDQSGSSYEEVYSMINRSSAHGKIISEKTLDEGWTEDNRYRVKLECVVVVEEGSADPGFLIDVMLNKDVYYPAEGEEVIVSVTPSADCFLTVFGISGDTISVLLPNQIIEKNFVESETRYEFPPQSYRQRGMHLRVELPAGMSRWAECVLVVATKDDVPIRFGELYARQGIVATYRALFQDLQRWLVQIPLDRRVEAMRTYEVRERTK